MVNSNLGSISHLLATIPSWQTTDDGRRTTDGRQPWQQSTVT